MIRKPASGKALIGVLLIEDNKEDAHIIRAFIKSASHLIPVEWFKNEKEFGGFLDTKDKDLEGPKLSGQYVIFLSLSENNKNLLDSFQAMHHTGHAVLKNVPVIILSHTGKGKSKYMSSRYGIQDCLLKPKSYEDIKNMILYLKETWLNPIFLKA